LHARAQNTHPHHATSSNHRHHVRRARHASLLHARARPRRRALARRCALRVAAAIVLVVDDPTAAAAAATGAGAPRASMPSHRHALHTGPSLSRVCPSAADACAKTQTHTQKLHRGAHAQHGLSAGHALASVAISGATGVAVGTALYAVLLRPAIRRVSELLDVASVTSHELAAAVEAWNALDAPAQNAVKMQLQGRLGALEAGAEAQRARTDALSKDVSALVAAVDAVDAAKQRGAAAGVAAATPVTPAPVVSAKTGAAKK
jgi:hypothetical protein